jgi:hypothetical protein
MRSLLHPDPAQRVTAAGALGHPFLTGDFPGAAQDAFPPKIEKPPLVLENTCDRELYAACCKMCDESEDEAEDVEEVVIAN